MILPANRLNTVSEYYFSVKETREEVLTENTLVR